MKDFKNILVPVDFTETSDAAVIRAISICTHLNAHLFLMHVVTHNEDQFSIIPEVRLPSNSITKLEVLLKTKMEDIQKEIFKKTGVLPKIFISTGNLETELMIFAKKNKIDLIVMGTNGTGGLDEQISGSNAEHIVKISDIPVLTLLSNKANDKFKNILIPIDNKLHSREKVNVAAAVAELFNAQVHVIGISVSTDKMELQKFRIKLQAVEKILTAKKLFYKFSILSSTNSALAAMEYAEKNNCDLIVINTGQESKMPSILLGAFAQKIVNHSTIPVLSVKPTPSEYSYEPLTGYANPYTN